MEFQPIFIYLSVVGFIRSVLTITGTDATWACVCGVVTQRDAVVRVQHGCQQTAEKCGRKKRKRRTKWGENGGDREEERKLWKEMCAKFVEQRALIFLFQDEAHTKDIQPRSFYFTSFVWVWNQPSETKQSWPEENNKPSPLSHTQEHEREQCMMGHRRDAVCWSVGDLRDQPQTHPNNLSD